MLKSINRLSTNFEFNITRKYGKRIKGECFHGFILKPTNYEGPTKIGVVVSNRIHKSAVIRNRIKRVIKAVLENKLNKFDKNFWIVIQPNHLIIGKNYEEFNTDFDQSIQKTSFTD